MVTAGRILLDNYGDRYCESIIHVLEAVLDQELKPNESTTRFDYRHEATVVLLGAAGKHLNKDDPHLIIILESLVKALSTPVASIQRAVADCLVSIVQVLKADDRMNEYLGTLLRKVETPIHTPLSSNLSHHRPSQVKPTVTDEVLPMV
jgi:hypothetical protein